MKIVNVQAAKTHLSRLLEEVIAGEEVILARAGKPIARLTPFQPVVKRRQLGALAGRIWESPDCWEPDAELEKILYSEQEWSVHSGFKVEEENP